MAGQGSESVGNTWAELWDVNTDPSKQQQQQEEKSKQGTTKLTKKLGESFNQTKEGATKSTKKVKDGASVGLFCIKDKCRKKPTE